MPRLENWSLCSGDDNPYLSPEQRTLALQGNVYDSTKFPDGSIIITSPIKGVSGREVQTRNSVYQLGSPDPNYVLWYREHGTGKYDLESDNPLDPRDCLENGMDDSFCKVPVEELLES